MTRSTKLERENRLDELEQRIQDAVHGEENGDNFAVEWRPADPEARPEGVVCDSDDGVLTYDL